MNLPTIHFVLSYIWKTLQKEFSTNSTNSTKTGSKRHMFFSKFQASLFEQFGDYHSLSPWKGVFFNNPPQKKGETYWNQTHKNSTAQRRKSCNRAFGSRLGWRAPLQLRMHPAGGIVFLRRGNQDTNGFLKNGDVDNFGTNKKKNLPGSSRKVTSQMDLFQNWPFQGLKLKWPPFGVSIRVTFEEARIWLYMYQVHPSS